MNDRLADIKKVSAQSAQDHVAIELQDNTKSGIFDKQIYTYEIYLSYHVNVRRFYATEQC